MKIQLEVYDLNQELFMMKNNKIVTFSPKQLRITYGYTRGGGVNWGDNNPPDYTQGWPAWISYSDRDTVHLADSLADGWVAHVDLFATKEDLLKSL